MKILLIYDHKIANISCDSDELNEIDVLSITSDVDTKDFNQRIIRSSQIEYRNIDFSSLLDTAAENLNEYLDKTLDEIVNIKIDGNSVGDNFIFQPYDTSAILFTELSEKNPFKNPSLSDIAKLMALESVIKKGEYNEILLYSKEKYLLEAIRKLSTKYNIEIKINKEGQFKSFNIFWRNILLMIKGNLFLVRSQAYSIFSKLISNQNTNNRDINNLICTYFPYLDEKKLKDGEYRNLYFWPLETELKKHYQKSMHVLIYARINNRSFFKSCLLAKKIIKEPYLFIESMLSIKDYLSIYYIWIRLLVKYLRSRKVIISNLNQSFASGIIIDSLDRSFFGTVLLSGIIYLRAFEKLAENNHEFLSSCIYLNEMQIWEKALNRSFFYGNQEVNRIGFQHTSVSKRLYFYYRNDEFSFSKKYEILPSIFGVNGMQAENLLKDCPYNILNLEALRQIGSMNTIDFEYQEFRKNIENKNNGFITFIASYDKNESRNIFKKLAKELDGRRDIYVTAVSHPSCDLEDLAKELNEELEVDISHSRNLVSSLKKSKIAITGSSTASVDALKAGCDVIIPILEDMINLNPILPNESLFEKSFASENLSKKIDKIIQIKRDETYYEKVFGYIHDFWNLDKGIPNWKKLLISSNQSSHENP